MIDPRTVEVLITIPLSSSLVEQLQRVSSRLRINIMPAKNPDEIPAHVWESTEILFTYTLLPEAGQAPNLRWIQFHTAGIDGVIDPSLLQNPDILYTTLSGAAVSQIAEYAIMMLLALGHRLPEILSYQRKVDWPKESWNLFTPLELLGSTVGIVGYGSIGREIARLLQPFGATILATKRDVMHPRDTGYVPEGMGDPEGDCFHRLYPIQALRSMLKECDYVIMTLPLTPETRNLIAEDELAVIKPTAYLVDIGRGGVIDQEALLSALSEGRLAGAALDVFSEEPLPKDSDFWKLPNVIISPHISGSSRNYD